MSTQTGLAGRLLPLLGITALLTGGALLGGCASKEEKPDAVLQELVMQFPGHYDNSVQVQSDVAKGIQPPHEALALDIVPIEAIMLGEKAADIILGRVPLAARNSADTSAADAHA